MKTVLVTLPLRLAQAVALASLMTPAFVLAALPSVAPPDAGRLTRELQAPVPAPRAGTSVTLPATTQDRVTPGGLKVRLKSIVFTGNTVYSQAYLQAATQNALGQSYDLAGLYALADAVSAYYRDNGYAFAKVFVPEDGFVDGVLTLTVVEGRYGQAKARADSPRRSAQAQAFLKPLTPGSVIEASVLERQTLLLGDQPGYRTVPVMKPGKAVGTGDVDVQLTRTPLISGSLSANNHGNRYTGYYQTRANVLINSPFRFGDQVAMSQLVSDERLRATSLSYSLPLGGNGLRATAGYSSTDYRLAREFKSLQASGRAQISSLGLSYPLLRSRTSNLTTSLQFQHKRFFDEQQSVNAQSHRASDTGTFAVNFDRSDDSGVTYGQIDWTLGNFDGSQSSTTLTQGRFARINADVVRLQRLSNQLSLFMRVNGQMASENLDSSESYSLGGPYAVRAYATGEGTGDEGRFGQLELRYQARNTLAPYMFFDAGRVRAEHKATAPGKAVRSLSGAGVGVRYQQGPWSLDSLVARRLVGGEPQSDPRDGTLIAWMILSYAF